METEWAWVIADWQLKSYSSARQTSPVKIDESYIHVHKRVALHLYSKNPEVIMAEHQWKILTKEIVLHHPFLRVEMEKVCLPGNRIIPDWPMVYMREYVNAVVLNKSGQFMILEGYKHGPDRFGWQVVGGYVEKDEEPLKAIQRELLEETGYSSEEWEHLGSYVFDANRNGGMGHFFLARNARFLTQPQNLDDERFTIKWVSFEEFEESTLSGRFISLTYATNAALGLVALRR